MFLVQGAVLVDVKRNAGRQVKCQSRGKRRREHGRKVHEQAKDRALLNLRELILTGRPRGASKRSSYAETSSSRIKAHVAEAEKRYRVPDSKPAKLSRRAEVHMERSVRESA